MMRLLCLGLLLLFGGAAWSAEKGGGGIRFGRDLAPIFRDRCAICHLTGQEPGGMSLHPGGAYASIVKVASIESALPRISPGKPEESYLLHKLDGTHLDVGGEGERMPFGMPPLDDATRDQIRKWISEGARNN